MGWMDDPEIPAAKPAKRAAPIDIKAIAAEEGASAPAQAVAASIYQQESSGGKNTKTSNAGAVGGMQMTPATFQRFAKPGEDINNPEHNARAAVRYIKHLDEKSGGDPSLIAAGYYSGEGGMEKARRGIAMRDPRNPDAPDSIQYARDVIARANASGPVAGGWMQDPEIEMPAPAGQSAGPANSRGAGFVDPRMVGSKTEKDQSRNKKTAPTGVAATSAAGGTLHGIWQGLRDPVDSVAQMLSRAVPGLDTVDRKIAEYVPGWGTADEVARKASTDYEEARKKRNGGNLTGIITGQQQESGIDWARAGGNALSAVVNPLNKLIPSAGATSIASKTLYGAASGALSGAIGRADQGPEEDYWTRKATDVGMGAVTGGIAAPVTAALGAVGRNIGQRVSNKLATVGAEEKIAEALLRDARPGLSAESAIGQAGARINKLGPRATVADSAGENTRQLLDTLATLPGQTKNNAAQVVRDRQVSRAGVMIDAADNGLGAGGRRLAGTVQDLADQRATAAAPLYQRLHAQQIAPTDNLQSITQAADELGASKLARTIATAERAPFTLGDAPGPIAFRDLDRLKQGLDTMIGRETDLAGKVSPTGNAVMKLKQALLQELDSATVDPATGASLYKAARDAYSGPSAMMSAAEMGRKLISSNEAGIQQSLKGLSASELDAARVGMFEGLRQKLGNSKAGRTEIMGAWENPAVADKLKAMFPNQRAYREFAATAAGEARLKLLESVGKGSQTAARQYGAGDLDMGTIGALGKAGGAAATGQIGGVVNALSEGWNRVKLPEAVRDEMGRLLLTQGAQGRQAINSLAVTAKQVADQRARNALITGSLAGRAGSAAASFGQ